MPTFVEVAPTDAAPQTPMTAIRRDYDVLKQRVDLDLHFPTRSLRGSTEITIQPHVKDLRALRLHARQCRPTHIQVGGITARWEYDEPYRKSQMGKATTVHQHGMLKSRIQRSLRPTPEPLLVIALPAKLKIQELRLDPVIALPLSNGIPGVASDALAVPETPTLQVNQSQVPQFAPIKVTIEFEVKDCRDGIHWVGCDDGDKRYPYMYTKLEPWAGNSSSIFPCLDDIAAKCAWEFAIRCPRTLGDAFRKPREPTGGSVDVEMVNGIEVPVQAQQLQDEFLIDLDPADAALELAVLCVGEAADDVADPEDDSRHTLLFHLNDAVTARHIAFAVGPFEHVDLTAFRGSEEEAKLGQTAVKVDGYCLPGRMAELENTCYPTCQAVDHISVNCGRFPFPTYQVLFVDDLIYDTAGAAGLTLCSNRLLFPQDIIEPLDRNTRILVRAVADQWSGVNIVPKELSDSWAVAGIAGYLTDAFMKKLSGNNQYRWEQKLAAEKVYDLDVDRPSIHQLGPLLHLDQSIREFLDLKSAVVLGILDRRLIKSSGSTGVLRIINKIFLNAKTGTLVNGELSTSDFQRTCERLGHNKLESFFRQWVMGSGCPIFHVSQRFNKKKLVVEMTITQRQLERQTKPAFEPSNFMREIKEYVQEVWAPEPQGLFTGPMTIRIHEADGTPYEHIVEIKEPVTRLEIPYNTKYKRLKRSRRQKERTNHDGPDDGEGTLLYCLGDILDSQEEREEWNLVDWTAEDENQMGQENYEWIRMDADFEWIGKIHLVMPLYMYISQLQQDRDIVAQYESMRYLLGSNPHHVSLTILLRTLMDERYFYGIRVLAAEGLALLSKDKLVDIGKHHLMKAFTEFYGETTGTDGHVMPRPNDFSNRVTFIMQCAIPQAMAKLRDAEDKVPRDVREFFRSLLTHNDNSDNSVSDCHYVATLMTCLADSLVASHKRVHVEPSFDFNFGGDEEEDVPAEPENPEAPFEKDAVNEIERYRRLDEWIMTYQNVYSTTAIECLQKLATAGIVQDKAVELLQYTRNSTADNVRLEAFRCLNEIGLTKRPVFLKHLLYSLSNDPSPYFRDRLLKYFGETLGHIALGDDDVEKKQPPPPVTDGGLVMEEAASTEIRRIEATRKTTPEGSLAALKVSLQEEEIFKHALWYAATSPILTLDEVGALCDIASLIYDAVTSHTITIPLPRPYRVKHLGKGKLRFFQYGTTYRTRPSKGLDWDDYTSLEEHGLKYTGPLSRETRKFLKEREEHKNLELRIAKTARELEQANSYAATTVWQQFRAPAPTAGPASITALPPAVSTPIEQKSGFKINIPAPAKRKASMDLSAHREPSPKVMKVNKVATPGSAPRAAIANAPRRPPTPSTVKASKRKLVALPLSISGSKKVREIISRPPQPGRASTSQPPAKKLVLSRKNSQSTTTSSHNKSTGVLKSPSTGTAWSPPPPSLTSGSQQQNFNLGGFRSFGHAASDAPPPSASFRSLSSAPESLSSPSRSFSGSSASRARPGVKPLSSLSPKTSAEGTAAMPPPPAKKFTLKLGGPKTPRPPPPSGGAGKSSASE
jgi:transcription initiation factor TFIID subunit 2